MSFFIDTNIIIYALKNTYPALKNKLLSHNPSEIKIPSIVKAELLLGAKKSRNPSSSLTTIHQFLLPFEVIPFGNQETEIYAQVRSNLESSGKIIGPNDLLIASIVLNHHGILITHNTKEFRRIPRLKIEDWT